MLLVLYMKIITIWPKTYSACVFEKKIFLEWCMYTKIIFLFFLRINRISTISAMNYLTLRNCGNVKMCSRNAKGKHWNFHKWIKLFQNKTSNITLSNFDECQLMLNFWQLNFRTKTTSKIVHISFIVSIFQT